MTERKQCANASVRHKIKASLLTKVQQTKGSGGGKGEEQSCVYKQSRVYEKAKGH